MSSDFLLGEFLLQTKEQDLKPRAPSLTSRLENRSARALLPILKNCLRVILGEPGRAPAKATAASAYALQLSTA